MGLYEKLSKLTKETGLNWQGVLPLVLFHMWVTPHWRTGLSAAVMVYGRPMRTSWDVHKKT